MWHLLSLEPSQPFKQARPKLMTKLLTTVPKVQRNVVLVFGAALLTVALFAILITLTNRQSKKTEQLVNHTYKMSLQAESIRSALAGSESVKREFVASRDQRLIPVLRSAWKGLMKLAEETHSLTTDPAQQEKMVRVKN